MSSRSAHWGWVVLGLWLAWGCGAKPAAPAGRVTGSALGVTAPLGSGTPATGPVQVTYFGPRGETDGQVEVSVSFDRPMVALGQDTQVDPGLFAMEPQVSGRTRWVGSQTLLFEPSAPLPMATEFRVRIARGARALDGQQLAEDLTFSFATPALALVEHEPGRSERYLQRRWIDLFFNQRVSAEQLAQFATLSMTRGHKPQVALSFSVERPDEKDPRRLRILSKTPFALSSQVSVTVRAGMPSEEGPRGLQADQVQTVRLYGPLRLVQSASCSGNDCVPRIVFSNPVHTREAYAALRFEPPLAVPLARDYDYESEELYFGSELAPDSTYRVRVEGELKDVYGTKLEGERVAVVRTPPLAPLARVLVEGDLMHADSVAPLGIQLQNLTDARLDLYPLAADEVMPQALESMRPRARAVVHRLGAAGGSERRRAEVDPAPLLHHGRGIVLASLVARAQGEELHERKLLAYTNLAPTLKVGADAGVLWVTGFSDARPVSGARVRIVVEQDTVATGTTDDKGLFAFTLPPRPKAADPSADYDERDVAAVVSKDDDVSFVRKLAGVGPWELVERASYGSSSARSISAHLFTERGIYRPGDTVQLKGILRSHAASGVTPARGALTLRVLDASESEIEHAKLELSTYGTFAHSVRIPGSSELGPLSIRVQHEGQTFTTSAEVAEYRPAELEVTVQPTRERAVRGETVQARIGGQYMFGAPAKDASAFWSARYVRRDFAPRELSGFAFEDEVERSLDGHDIEVVASGEGKLDAHGELLVEAPLASAPLTGPSVLELETSVTLSGVQASGRARVDITPASLVVGLRPATALAEAQRSLDLELVALSPLAEPVQAALLDVTFARRVFTSKLVDGTVQRAAHDEHVGGCKLKSRREPARCSVTPREPGLHIARVTGKDRAGRVSTAARFVYVYGAGQASWGGDEDSYVLALQSDRTELALGDTAKLLVPSPWADAEALVTVEREGVLSVERVRVGRASTIDVRIDERFVPNAFVSVLLLRPLDGSGLQTDLPYRIGALELAADVSLRKLAVEVVPDSQDKRPGEELTVQLAVRDGAGKPTPAELTVFAVDEGVLTLTGYRTPDPFAAIYAPRALGVWTSDARRSLAHALSGDGDEKGGDAGGGGGELLRSHFAAVALYVPSLETDAQGRAALRFKLPDGTTRYRIMAVAAARGAEVGAGESFVRTKKPLMLRPLAPRVLRAGDHFQAGVVVHNEQTAAVDVEVELTASGLTLAQAAKQSVRVPASGAVELRFALRAHQVGQAQLRFSAKAGAERDGVSITRSVLSPSVLETVSAYGITSDRKREALAPLPNLRRDVGGLSLTLSTSALAELEGTARALLRYEYGCTEQLSSRLIALAALERLRKPLALSDASFGAQAETLVSQLESHQRGDGGFGLWAPNDRTPSPLSAFLTAYALIAFEQLRGAGIAVSPHARERALSYLTSALRATPPAGGVASLGGAERAFVVYALARSGLFDAGYVGKLFEQRASLPVFARIELLHALASQAHRDPRSETLLMELAAGVRLTGDEAHLETNAGDGYAALFVSDVRATAQLLQALLLHAPEHALLPKLARWLSGARGRDGSWNDTHESAWGVMALASYHESREKTPADMKAEVALGARTLGPATLAGARAKASFELPMRDLPTRGEALVFDKKGTGSLHYTMRLSYAQADLPSAASERGFFVERSYERIPPAALARGDSRGELGLRAVVGDYVRVTLRIAVPAARRFVLIEDPIPAGLEPVDFRLATELQGAASAISNEAPCDHQELRDDRAMFAVNALQPGLYTYSYLARASTAGTFVAPPAVAFEMYHPETQGLTAATGFEVVAP